MSLPLLETYDLVAHAEVLEQRLAGAMLTLSAREGMTDEKAWLDAAWRHVARGREGIGDLLTRVLRLPELAPARGERGRALQSRAVDAVEQLQVAIVAAGGERSPLIEALFRNLKPPAMRRSDRDDFEAFCDDIEKRLGASYPKRMLADETYLSVGPALEQLRLAFGGWRSVFTSVPLTDEEASALREELEVAAARIDLPSRQAVLLAEAALLPERALLEESAILDRPRRRATRALRTELEEEPTP